MEGMLIRSRARWIGEGEKVSKCFCSLEKRHYTSKIIRKIEKQDDTYLLTLTEFSGLFLVCVSYFPLRVISF